nr:N-acetylmuramoyl-L-alanine amidase [Streptomyces violens]
MSLKSRVWVTAGAVLLGGAGVATYAVAGPAGLDGKARKPAVHDVKLADLGAGRKGLAKRDTSRFSAVMVSWNDPHAEVKGTPEVRYRAAGTDEWSGWTKLPDDPYSADGAEAERAGTRGGTTSVWTGDADGVEVRLVRADGSAATGQPAGLEVNLLDPGTGGAPAAFAEPVAYAEDPTTAPTAPATDTPSPTPTEPATGTPSPTPTGTATTTPSPEPTPTVPAPRPSTVVKPPVITQQEWGASTDYDGTPSYGTEIKAAVVHHTGVDSDNKISCAESRQRMRTIQQEHFTRGYYDIGYNFVVDKCGQIFEGRSGGMELPVTGAHDVGFNTNTVGISYIGNYMSAKPSRAAMDAVARVIAWKFGMYGIDPAGKVTMTSGTDAGVDGNKIPKGSSVELPRVFGHRDTNSTLCPGDNLYSKLSLIRSLAAAPGVSHALATSDVDRDGVSDLVAGTPKASSGGRVTVVPGGINGPVSAKKIALTQSSAGVPGANESGDQWGAATAWGDLNGDGHADLAIGSPGEDDSSNTDRGAVTLLYGPALNTGTTMQLGDGFSYAGAKFGAAVAVGDFDADGKADVFAASTGSGGTWSARYSKGGEDASTISTASGSLAYADAASGDFNRDGYADVALNYRDTGLVGRVVWFKGGANGLSKVGTLSVKGGRAIAAGDVNGNGYDDIAIGQPYTSESGAYAGGQVTVVPGTATGFTTTGMKTVHQDTSGVPGAAEAGDALGWSVSVGDYDADGYADVLAGAPNEDTTRDGTNRGNSGTSLLLRGTSSGLTGTGALSLHQDTSGVSGATETDDKLGSAASLTDLSGYGRADLTLGAEGEDAGNGTLLHIPSNSTGVSPSQAVYFGLTQLGTPTGARLGQQLTP